MPRTDPSTGEEIVDFSDAGAWNARRSESVEKSFIGRLDRVVPPVRRSRIMSRRSFEGARDHPRNVVRRYEHLTRHLAGRVKLGERDDTLVRRDLENRIRRRVNDPRARSLVLLSELLNDRGAARRDVADYAPPGPGRECLQQFAGKALRKSREGLFEMNAGDLPVPGRAVLARRCGL